MPLEIVRVPDNGRFGDAVVQHQGAFDFGGADAVAGDVDHVIDPSGYPQVTVLVAARAVAGEVVTRQWLEVGIDHSLRVAVHAADLSGPAGLDRQHAAAGAFNQLALVVQ
ncbi:hypothetical protein D3C76_1212920 [compost metagenome]